jgi:hypothetical protein
LAALWHLRVYREKSEGRSGRVELRQDGRARVGCRLWGHLFVTAQGTAAGAIAEFLSRRRGLERACEVLVAWARTV